MLSFSAKVKSLSESLASVRNGRRGQVKHIKSLSLLQRLIFSFPSQIVFFCISCHFSFHFISSVKLFSFFFFFAIAHRQLRRKAFFFYRSQAGCTLNCYQVFTHQKQRESRENKQTRGTISSHFLFQQYNPLNRQAKRFFWKTQNHTPVCLWFTTPQTLPVLAAVR